MSIKEEWIDVTPEWAEEVLEKHWKRVEKGQFINRPVSLSKISQLVADMKNGDYKRTPEPIVFDIDGNLTDGQHRMEAVRQSKTTQNMKVSSGWPKEIIDVLDTGKPRSIGSILHMKGLERGGALASVLGTMVRIVFRGHNSNLTTTSALALMKQFNIQGGIAALLKKSTNSRDYAGRTLGPIVYYWLTEPKKATELAESFFNFRTVKGSPVAAMLQWSKVGGRKQNTQDVLRAMATTIRAWDAGNKLQQLRPTTEAIIWLANTNPKFVDWTKEHIASRN